MAEMDVRSELRMERNVVKKVLRKLGVDWPALGAETDKLPTSESLASCHVLTSNLEQAPA